MAVADVILRIGSSMGPGGLASLQAGIQMVAQLGGKVVEAVKELDRFAKVLERVDMRMVNYADAAAKGQVDTFELMRSLQSIQHAFANTGVDFYKEDLALLSKASTNLAQITGKDATQAFKELAASVSKGTTRALKEYGIYISQGTYLSKTHRDILNALREGYGDLEVKLTRTSERLNALNNNWETFKGLVYDSYTHMVDATGVLDALNEKLSALNTILSEGGAGLRAYMFSLEGAIDSLKQMLGLSDDFKRKMNLHHMIAKTEAETRDILKGMEKPQAAPEPKGLRKTGGGGTLIGVTEGADVDAIQRMSDAGYYADVELHAQLTGLPFETVDELLAAEAEFAREPAKLGYGGPSTLTARTSQFESAAQNVDDKLEEMRMLEEQRENEFDAWLDRLDMERAAREEQLSFADDFSIVWQEALNGVTVGTMAAQASMDLMRGTWNAAIENAITGQQTFGAAIKNMLKDLGMAIAKEAGWRAAMEAVHAIAAAATYQYGKAAKHAIAAAGYAALAISAGAASAAMHRNTAVSSAPSEGSAASGTTPQYGTTYPEGGASQRGEVHVHVRLEGDSGQIFTVVEEENSSRARAGYESFAVAS